MQNARIVRGGESVGHAHQQFDNLPPIAPLGFHPIAERSSIHKFGNQILAGVYLSGIVNSEDVRVIERGCHLRLALKPASSCCIGQVVGKKFDRNPPVQPGIVSLKHHAHPASANHGLDFILPKFRARSDRPSSRFALPHWLIQQLRSAGLR